MSSAHSIKIDKKDLMTTVVFVAAMFSLAVLALKCLWYGGEFISAVFLAMLGVVWLIIFSVHVDGLAKSWSEERMWIVRASVLTIGVSCLCSVYFMANPLRDNPGVWVTSSATTLSRPAVFAWPFVSNVSIVRGDYAFDGSAGGLDPITISSRARDTEHGSLVLEVKAGGFVLDRRNPLELERILLDKAALGNAREMIADQLRDFISRAVDEQLRAMTLAEVDSTHYLGLAVSNGIGEHLLAMDLPKVAGIRWKDGEVRIRQDSRPKVVFNQ